MAEPTTRPDAIWTCPECNRAYPTREAVTACLERHLSAAAYSRWERHRADRADSIVRPVRDAHTARPRPDVPHYATGDVELVDALRSMLSPDEYRGYLRGQVVKYLWRCPHKGTPTQDIEKARVYLGWLEEAFSGEGSP